MEKSQKPAFVTKKDIIKMVAAFVLIPVIVFSGLLGGAICLLSDAGIGYSLIELYVQDEDCSDFTVSFELYDVHPEDLYREDALEYLQELWNAQK